MGTIDNKIVFPRLRG